MPTRGKKSFWEQFPLVVGALTALLAAVTGLIVAWHTLGGTQSQADQVVANGLHLAPVGNQTGEANPATSRESSQAERPPPAQDVPPAAQSAITIPAASPAEDAPAAQAVRSGCDRVGTLRSSPSSGSIVEFTVVNRSSHPIWLYWIDHQGSLIGVGDNGQPYAQLQPNQQVALQSYPLHLWMIADQQAECRRIVTVPVTESVYEYR